MLGCLELLIGFEQIGDRQGGVEEQLPIIQLVGAPEVHLGAVDRDRRGDGAGRELEAAERKLGYERNLLGPEIEQTIDTAREQQGTQIVDRRGGQPDRLEIVLERIDGRAGIEEADRGRRRPLVENVDNESHFQGLRRLALKRRIDAVHQVMEIDIGVEPPVLVEIALFGQLVEDRL